MAELPVHRVSLATTATALVALAALLITAPHQVGLIVVAALLVGHHLFDRRLPKMPLLVWTMRFVLFLILILTSDIEDRGLRRLYLKTDYSNLFGYLCAVELALQYWQRRDKHPPRGEALVLSGLIFAVATNTPEHRYLQWLTPLFMGLVLLSMRDFRPRRPAVEHARTRWSVRTARLVGVACAFGIAIAVIGAIRLWGDILENKLNFTRLVNLPGDPRGIGASTEPFLGPSSDLPGSTLRVIRVEGLTGESHLRGLAFDRYRNKDRKSVV